VTGEAVDAWPEEAVMTVPSERFAGALGASAGILGILANQFLDLIGGIALLAASVALLGGWKHGRGAVLVTGVVGALLAGLDLWIGLGAPIPCVLRLLLIAGTMVLLAKTSLSEPGSRGGMA